MDATHIYNKISTLYIVFFKTEQLSPISHCSIQLLNKNEKNVDKIIFHVLGL